MKYKLLLIVLTAFSLSIKAQTHSETFAACDSSYTAMCELLTTNQLKVTITNGLKDSSKTDYTITTTDLDIFAITFKNKFKMINASCTDTAHILAFSRKLYFNSTILDTLRPIAGLFTAWDSVPLRMHYNVKDRGNQYTGVDTSIKFKIKNVTGEITDGYIENIKVAVQFRDTARHIDSVKYFSVPYPIGISSIANFKKYSSTELLDINSDVRLKKVLRSQYDTSIQKKHDIINRQYYILLSDAIQYDYYFGIYRRDFSPENMVLAIDGGHSALLHKEETHKLFEAHIFTDFVGLKEDKPNGLIQTTMSKRINTNTKQHLAPRFIYWLYKSYGGFQYVSPTITISKLEDHNKKLFLGNLDSVRQNPGQTDTSKFNVSSKRYFTALDLFQHQSFSAGLDVNIGYLNNHDLKYNIYFNAGIRLGVTPIRDSLTGAGTNNLSKTGVIKEYSVNTLQLCPQIILNFLPEERFSLSIAEKFIYLKPLVQGIQLVSIDKNNFAKLNASKSNSLNVLDMLMTYQVNQNTNSKLFGRVGFNSDWKNVNNNFAQIQIGYSTFILGKN